MRRLIICSALVLAALAALAPAAQAGFGLKEVSVSAVNRDGSPATQAGSHPYEYTVHFGLNLQDDAAQTPEGRLRTIVVGLPQGMVGDPTAIPVCPRTAFEGDVPHCAPETQVGVIDLAFVVNGSGLVLKSPVYNLTSAPGRAATLGFNATGIATFQEASVRSDSDFGINISDFAIPAELEFQSVTETIWGEPADPEHTPERRCSDGSSGCTSSLSPAPFLTLPVSCGSEAVTTVEVESLETPGVFSKSAVFEEAGSPLPIDGCNALQFEPSIEAQPTTSVADSPTGLDFNLHQPQNRESEGLSTGALRDTTVTLPPGLDLNPASASGLAACSESQIGLLSQGGGGGVHFSTSPQSCPAAAKLGSATVISPPLGEFDETGKAIGSRPLHGAVYLAKPFDNPFGSLLAIYLVIEDEATGVVAKLAGRISPDPATGRLTARFDESPQLPLEDISLHFFAGARAALVTPPTCGAAGGGPHTTTSTLVPWSAPEGDVAHPSSSFTLLAGPGGGGCAGSEAQLPNSPNFSAGTMTPQAGAYSPFVLKLGRADGTQRLSQIDATLPPGLTGRLAGVGYCSEAAIAQAEGREAPNLGALEQAAPSCPASSELGVVDVGAGAGPNPLFVRGHAYLAGPYKGAPLSMVIVTPAVAGPFDLGAVVVRSALYVNEETAQIHAVSDPIPQLLEGIPLDVRTILVKLERDQFTLNPTSCDPMSMLAGATSSLGQAVSLIDRFQVGGCRPLPFKPKLSLSLKGKTQRSGNPALRAVLKMPPGSANIAFAQLALPASEFLDQGNLDKVCTQPELRSASCPAGSVYGHAKAWSPLLDKPLEGPVYLGVGYGHTLPDLVADLGGQIRILLHGRIDTTKQAAIRNTFEIVPDAPVTKFVLEMKGGEKYGLLTNSEELCKRPHRASGRFLAHNGKVRALRPLLKVKCPGSKGKRGRGSGRR